MRSLEGAASSSINFRTAVRAASSPKSTSGRPLLLGEYAQSPVSSHQRDQRHLAVQSASVVTTYRGETSPWTKLVNGTTESSDSTSLGTFHQTAVEISNEEHTTILPFLSLKVDLLRDFPHLSEDIVFAYVQDYAVTAPYPIVYWPYVRDVAKQGLQRKEYARWGQLVCLLMVSPESHLKIQIESEGN